MKRLFIPVLTCLFVVMSAISTSAAGTDPKSVPSTDQFKEAQRCTRVIISTSQGLRYTKPGTYLDVIPNNCGTIHTSITVSAPMSSSIAPTAKSRTVTADHRVDNILGIRLWEVSTTETFTYDGDTLLSYDNPPTPSCIAAGAYHCKEDTVGGQDDIKGWSAHVWNHQKLSMGVASWDILDWTENQTIRMKGDGGAFPEYN